MSKSLERDARLRERFAPDYRQGAAYAFATAALLAVQEPFSALAAGKLSAFDFLGLTQVALLLSLPLLLVRPAARSDFAEILTTPRHWPKLLALFAIGCAGLLLYDVALSSAHPIITAAVLNLSPFWAALVAWGVSGKHLPPPRMVFIGCFVVAFAGAMVVAVSQIDASASNLRHDVLYSLFHSRWALALPMPVFFALSGSLLYKWFGAYDEAAAISCNFLISSAALIPLALWRLQGTAALDAGDAPAILLLLVGTLTSSAAGRLLYQSALSATQNDNGFVTMFFLAIPAISAAISWGLSRWIVVLRVSFSYLFFEGLALVTVPLAVFAIVATRKLSPPAR